MLSIVFLLILVPFISVNAAAASGDETFAEMYAPILYFEGEEECYPVDASYHIDNSYLFEVESSTPIDTDPKNVDLSQITSDGFYLDNQHS